MADGIDCDGRRQHPPADAPEHAAETEASDAMELLDHNLDGQLQFHRVSRAVNASKFTGDPGIQINPL